MSSAAGIGEGNSQLPLALTMGEPSGIGPEIAMRAWASRDAEQLPVFAIYGDINLLTARAEGLGIALTLERIGCIGEAREAFAHALPVVEIKFPARSEAGRPNTANAAATIESIRRAVADVASGKASAIVTNPIAKSVLYDAGFAHPGHTEYLGELAGNYWPGAATTPAMMLAVPALRVVPITIHIALSAVPAALTTSKIVTVAKIVDTALRNDFGIARPRVAIAGLNPHAGEDGALGREDLDIVLPAVEALREAGLDVSGPLAADTMFHASARAKYDVAIAMYHDQALIPIKTLAFDEGVNVTLGLPFVRTSPDHGTAFDIAGKGIASPKSLIAAIRLAGEIAARRSLVAGRAKP